MATATTPEQSARDVLRIFAAKAVRTGDSLTRAELSLTFQQTGGINAELLDGLRYAISQGWIEKNGTAFRLTNAGLSA
jgi:coproporphyrinogen III oxidase-like Fe-S oxidoreductase